MGLITEQCPHRRASLAYGIPTDDGIRCPYHGWEFGHSGAMPRPAERAGEELVQEQGQDAGLCGRGDGRDVLGLLGPAESKPLLPRIDGFVADGTIRMLRPRAHSGELAADHGELARPDPHRMAARPHLRVRQGAEGPGPQGRDQRAAREDRVPRVRARHHQAPPAGRPLGGLRRLEDRPPGGVPEHPVGRQRRRDLALLRVPDPRAGRRHATPCISGTRPMCRRRATKVAPRSARQGPRL